LRYQREKFAYWTLSAGFGYHQRDGEERMERGRGKNSESFPEEVMTQPAQPHIET
jgi:hypothetical protein